MLSKLDGNFKVLFEIPGNLLLKLFIASGINIFVNVKLQVKEGLGSHQLSAAEHKFFIFVLVCQRAILIEALVEYNKEQG